MHAFVGQEATSIVLGESIGGLTDIMFRRGSEARSKYFSAWPLGGLLLLGGDLNPILGFYFPLFSMVFPQGIAIRVEICGREWNQKCSFFVVKLLTKFSCVLAIVCLPQ